MLWIVVIVYLFSLANGLALLALDGMWPHAAQSRGAPAEAAELIAAPDAGILARFSLLLMAAAVALAGILQRWSGLP
jgi:hypothetical protein